jgi:glycosyltransferase involved in cell wall biosynthesis
MLKKLTIAIPTYNRSDYLLKLLNTIPHSYAGDVVISDNENLTRIEIKNKFPEFRFYSSDKKLKMFENWNLALKKVSTEFFIIPSDDDLFCKDSFEIINDTLKSYSDYDVFIFGHNTINEKDIISNNWKPLKLITYEKGDGFKVFSKGVNARCPSIIFRTSLAQKMGFFNEKLEFTASDSLLIQKCLLYGKSVFIPEIISSYRVWPNNATSQLISKKIWIDKIELWTNYLSEILEKDFSERFTNKEIKKIKDEICLRNLTAGVSNILKEGTFLEALEYLKSNRYPYKANFKTQIILIKNLLVR